MSQAQYYMIFIVSKKDVSRNDIEKKMNLAVDWFRLDDKFWVLYTTGDEEKWYSRLKPFVKPEGSLFVCKLDTTHRQGWMKASFWKWIRREEE